MKRRDFILATTALTTTALFGASSPTASEAEKPSGAVTLYYEFKLAGIEKKPMLKTIAEFAQTLKTKKGFLSLALKELVGDSTMVNNLPIALKGVLQTAYIDAAKEGRRAFVYTMLIRFESYDAMENSGAKALFGSMVTPHLFAYKMENGKPIKLPIKLDFYEAIFTTVSAGDAHGIYTTQAEILKFLSTPKDTLNQSITVQNHVSIHDNNTALMNQKTSALLKVAQETYQPSTNKDNGIAGTLADTNYRKAVTTEILQNTQVRGDLRDYIMHGVWESVADHENSHIDPRFMAAAAPVGAMVVVGPVEPFYTTLYLA